MDCAIFFSVFICTLWMLVASDSTSNKTIDLPFKTNLATDLLSLPIRTKIITVRFGADDVTPEQQCQCTLFYLCDKENQVPLSNGRSCGDNIYVCCSIIVNLNNIRNDNNNVAAGDINANTASNGSNDDNGGGRVGPGGFIVGDNGNSNNADTSSTGIPNQSIVTNMNDACICVPLTLCNQVSTTSMSGIGELNTKNSLCTINQICCPQSMLINSGTDGTGGIGSSGGVTDGNKGITKNGAGSGSLCGIRNVGVTTRIMAPDNSSQTIFGEFPWMALLLKTARMPNGERISNVFVCGASLLSDTIVLTAAHCVSDTSMDLRVRVGEYNIHLESNKEPKPHQDRTVVQVIQHPLFNRKTLFNDIAVMKVSEPFTFDSHIAPICIPPLNTEFSDFDVYDPQNCIATGWGKTSFGPNGSIPAILKKVDLTLVPNDQCQQRLRGTRLGSAFKLHSSFICAGLQPGIDTCEGDGGGPLVCALRNDSNRFIQVGMTAWGIGCGTGVPSVYASVAANIDWLVTQFSSLTTGLRAENRFGSNTFSYHSAKNHSV